MLYRFLFLGMVIGTLTSFLGTPVCRAQNLLANPNFTSGNTGFTSGYTFNASSLLSTASYSVGSDPNTFISSATSMGDHTTGTGLMLLANGSTVANTVLWQETVPVSTGTGYVFSGWISTFDRSGTFNEIPIDINPANYAFLVNGSQIGTFQLPPNSNDGVWAPFSANWASGGATSAQLQILLTRTDISGNDAAVDDLVFGVPEPGAIAFLGLAALPLLVGRRVRSCFVKA